MPDQVVETGVKPEVKPADYSNLEARMGIKPEAAKPPVETPATEVKPTPEAKVETPAVEVKPEEKPAAINVDELTDDQINELIEKRTGKKVLLADLNKPEPKSKEDQEKEVQEFKNKAHSWALEQGKIKKDEYDNAIIGQSKTDRELALAAFTAEMQAEDKDITPEEVEEMFKDTYHESDPESKLYKIGKKEIQKLAKDIRNTNYNIPDYEAEYKEVVQTEEAYRSYKAAVKKVGAEIPKDFEIVMPYQYLDGVKSDITYKIPVDDKVFNKLLADASSENSFLAENFFSDGKVDEKQLTKKLNHNLKALMFDPLIQEILKQNTKEVETRMEVVLGNKRNGAPELNDGRQNTQKPPQKVIDYTTLDNAMAGKR